MDRVLMGIRPRPPSSWIRAKRKDEEINHRRFIGFRHDPNNGHCHNRLSLKGSVNRLFLLMVPRMVKRVQDNSIANFPRTQLAGIE
jgi:hypothetical protein